MSTSAADPLVDHAVRLFTFLGRAQQLRAPIVRDIESYRTEGAVHWWHELPEHPAVYTTDGTAADGSLLTIDRIPPVEPPRPGPELRTWLAGRVDDPRQAPALLDDENHPLGEHPEIADAFATYLGPWEEWARRELRDGPVREVYAALFATYVKASGRPDELETVIGTGLLAWRPGQGQTLRRHLSTTPVRVAFDEDTARLVVAVDDGGELPRVETEMIDPGLIRDPATINAVQERAREAAGSPLDPDHAGEIARRVVHLLAADAEYRDDMTPPPVTPRPIGAFAPALVLRRRSQQGLVEVFRRIVAQIQESGQVPPGVRPLVDPDAVPAVDTSGEPAAGALVTIDDEPFLPLPVNETQLRILQRVDSHAQTLIQGPPGTGKTHTAAVLIAHLLAQGKRVLVTAQTDRALKEVRGKLPDPIRPLAVAIVGAGREEMSDLRVAVERIGAAAGDFDAAESGRAITEHLTRIDALRRQRASLQHTLAEARRREVDDKTFTGYSGTAASIAARLEDERAEHGWIEDLAAPADDQPPMRSADVLRWHAALLDEELIRDEPAAQSVLVDLRSVPDAGTFAALVSVERTSQEEAARLRQYAHHPAYTAVERLPATDREALGQRYSRLVTETGALAGRSEPWLRNAALNDVLDGRPQRWADHRDRMGALLVRLREVVSQLGVVVDVRVSGPHGGLDPHALNLLTHLAGGGQIKVSGDGTPRIGMLTARPVKDAADFFERVRVDGVPATTTDQLTAVRRWLDVHRLLDALDRAAPAARAEVPGDVTERLHGHADTHALLERLLRLGAALHEEDRASAAAGLPPTVWRDGRTTSEVVQLPAAVASAEQETTARAAIQKVLDDIDDVARRPDAGAVVAQLRAAVSDRDPAAYTAARLRLERLHEVRAMCAARAAARDVLWTAAPDLADAIERMPEDPLWPTRLADLEKAWMWAAAGVRIDNLVRTDVGDVQHRIVEIEDLIRRQVQELASRRAWGHAVRPDRLTQRSRASLEQYAGLVKGFGKTGGKYREQRRTEIRAALDRCRAAVPVWIMPLYRIADQLSVEPGMFDVVIVDEASQAGVEATFLQYLAPRIVVIGDDRQVSPSAVGVDQQELRDLARHHLYDDQYRSTWQDPQRSLFDEAKMRFSGMLTLTEHRRCVPEIINFSNRIAYEPDGVRLIPVRQFGPDRLVPICPVFVHDGYERGSSAARTNPAEVDALVDQLEKCAADPRYDGLTFGVISLLGSGQAKAIEQKLLERMSPQQWVDRDLRCGDAADFQGSERDVMFLSMVAAPGPDRRITALTSAQYVQRYNVAFSRAKDQVWVFHSVPLADLHNPEDMRFQLLDYCYGITARSSADDERFVTAPVREDVVVQPFGSRFEQRVCNRIADRGYSVVPQYPALGYSIDLVVVGAHARLAVECDGDFWHGPEAHQRDMARQRELERCGWTFVRVLESDFVRDPASAMAVVWEQLEGLEIHPSGWLPPAPADLTDQPAMPINVDDDPATVEIPVAISAADRSEPSPVSPVSPADAAHASTPEEPTLAELDPYAAFSGDLVPVGSARSQDLVDGLVQIVAAEGPIVGHRLHSVYVRSSAGQRVGSQIARLLNRAVSTAVRQGRLIQYDPLGEVGIKPRTFRLPEQEAVRVRELGPREFDHVPPSELAAVMARVADRLGWDDLDTVHRYTALTYGVRRRGPSIRQRLNAVTALARTADGLPTGSDPQ
ncbi:AAA family ATPase [Pseudonocardia sp. KRD-169]|uniref:AAA family ATPase n=1 Tax=Pseudonocardia abyssalis TaxID=2792008 RepID=A0ABS6UMR9_9PSEU|nr:AAA family ATPase [Pseudonocardia abyssalis]MBW0133537.1 AAA family ATPase [Pseudonocardia abyssalis]